MRQSWPVSAALDTLMLMFEGEDALEVPQRVLFLGAQADARLVEWPSVVGWQPLQMLAEPWDQAGLERWDEVLDEKFDMVIGLPGKAKDEVLAMFGVARKHLKPGGMVVMSMANTAGAGRFEKQLARATGGVRSFQKNKCRAFAARETGGWDEGMFAEWVKLAEVTACGDTGYVTTAGVFSAQHPDPGSVLLLAHLPAMLSGRVADLGAGWGFLSDGILRKCKGVRRMDLYEVDARALKCARANVRSEGVDLGFHWHDVTTGLLDEYEVVVMNPPFHTGQETDVLLGQQFLIAAIKGLKRGGKLYLVANRQLPYEPVLAAMQLSYRSLAEDSVYKVMMATKPY